MVSFDIAVSAECHTGKKIPFSGDITNAGDRIIYYERLMNEFEHSNQQAITKKIIEQAG